MNALSALPVLRLADAQDTAYFHANIGQTRMVRGLGISVMAVALRIFGLPYYLPYFPIAATLYFGGTAFWQTIKTAHITKELFQTLNSPPSQNAAPRGKGQTGMGEQLLTNTTKLTYVKGLVAGETAPAIAFQVNYANQPPESYPKVHQFKDQLIIILGNFIESSPNVLKNSSPTGLEDFYTNIYTAALQEAKSKGISQVSIKADSKMAALGRNELPIAALKKVITEKFPSDFTEIRYVQS